MTRTSEQHLRESLSAAIDGEAEPLELRRALNAAGEDPELRERWHTAHLIGTVLRGEPVAAASHLPALDAEPQSARPLAAARVGWRWAGTAAGGAVAAVAALVVVATFGGNVGGDSDEAAAPAATGPAPPLLADTQGPASQFAGAPTELDMRRANAYLLHHARHTTAAARPAAMPYVKALAHDGPRPAALPRRQ